MKSLQNIAMCFCFFVVSNTFAQIGYQKDSLQIKVYTEIEYRAGLVKDIRVNKIFCDYCTKHQKKLIKEEAMRRTYMVRNEEGLKINNGMYKHALYIRISKEDFLEMKRDSIANDH